MFFAYGEKEITYLKQKDKRLAEIIDKIGMIEREVDTDLFSAVIHHIIGQQISTKAQATIWQRLQEGLGSVNADTILTSGIDRLQSFGMTFKKAEYITDFAVKVQNRAFDLEGIWDKTDDEAIEELSSLKGIGFHQGVQFALLAEHFDAELLDLGRCLRFELFDTSEKFIDFVGHILIVYAFSVFLPINIITTR